MVSVNILVREILEQNCLICLGLTLKTDINNKQFKRNKLSAMSGNIMLGLKI